MKPQQLIKTIEKDYLIVGSWAREIILKRLVISSTAATVLTVLVALKVIPLGLDTKLTALVAVAFTYLTAVVGALWARTGTTVADVKLNPISSTGQALIEAPLAAAALQAAGVVSGPVLAGLDADAAATLADPIAPITAADPAPAVVAPTETVAAPVTFTPVEDPT